MVVSRHSTIYKNVKYYLGGGCCSFLFSSAVSIAMIVVGTYQILMHKFLFLIKIGAQYHIEDDKCTTATGCVL